MPTSIARNEPTFQYLQLSWPREYVVEIALVREPVNAFTQEVCEELDRCIRYLESLFPSRARALVLASALERCVFTAGFQMTELHLPSTTEQRFTELWLASVRVCTRLYTTPLTTVAALRGACYTVGCMLALCCDIRIAEPSVEIGLSEAALGITVPKYWAQLFMSRASDRPKAERALFAGEMLDARSAFEIALIDCIVQGNVRVHAAHTAAVSLQRCNPVGRAKTKQNIRRHWADEWLAFAREEGSLAWSDLSSDQSVADITKALKQLRRSKL